MKLATSASPRFTHFTRPPGGVLASRSVIRERPTPTQDALARLVTSNVTRTAMLRPFNRPSISDLTFFVTGPLNSRRGRHCFALSIILTACSLFESEPQRKSWHQTLCEPAITGASCPCSSRPKLCAPETWQDAKQQVPCTKRELNHGNVCIGHSVILLNPALQANCKFLASIKARQSYSPSDPAFGNGERFPPV